MPARECVQAKRSENWSGPEEQQRLPDHLKWRTTERKVEVGEESKVEKMEE